MTTQNRPKIISLIIPTDDEITLFAMGFTCALLLIARAASVRLVMRARAAAKLILRQDETTMCEVNP